LKSEGSKWQDKLPARAAAVSTSEMAAKMFNVDHAGDGGLDGKHRLQQWSCMFCAVEKSPGQSGSGVHTSLLTALPTKENRHPGTGPQTSPSDRFCVISLADGPRSNHAERRT
jgi:hypothetical protein